MRGDDGRLPGAHPAAGSGEEQQLLVSWDSSPRDYPRDRCVHQLIEAQARSTPDAIAIRCGGRQISYKELNSEANRVAQRLRRLGIGPEMLVGLCLERSAEMYVALLAILKAGGAYVPLNPADPDETLTDIIADVQPVLVLTHRCVRGRLPGHSTAVMFVEDVIASAAVEADADLNVEMTPENLAYVIFTSGSTGKPKGVLITHRSLVSHAASIKNYFSLRGSDRVLQFSPLTFDVSAEEIFPTWLSGATVVPSSAGAAAPAVSTLIEFIEDHKITVLNLPAPYWDEWMSELDRLGIPPSVRMLVVGSDRVSPKKFLKCSRHVGKRVRLCNAYGLTEATITATIYEADGELPSTVDCVPIGRPIANAEIYILDEQLNLVPFGVAGELYIGGDCLARGYLNRPELTSERFIPNPYSEAKRARLYKTGDLARYLPDGNLEYLGRMDNQVKLRGFRIELGAIEAVIRRVAEVQDVTVIVREDRPGDKRLVAYVVCQGQTDLSAERLRTLLSERLPNYMVPSSFVFLARFPLTPSGKIDRRGLPAPDVEPRQTRGALVAPRTPTERQLVQIWEEILSVSQIGVSDNFFDLGGNSLLGLRLILRIEKTFGKTLPLAGIYETPTLEGLSRAIDELAGEARQWGSLITLQPNGSRTPFFMIHGEASNAFLPRYLGPDQPLYGMKHQGEDGWEARYTTVEDIAAHYLSEIRAVQPTGPYLLGGYCFGGVIAFEMAQQLRKQNQAVPLLVLLGPCEPGTGLRLDGGNNGTEAAAPLIQWRHEVRRLVNKFRSLDPAQKARWVLGWLRAKIKVHVINPIVRAVPTFQKLTCRTYRRLGCRLPLWLRTFYILSVYEEAINRYAAESYSGRVILFKPINDWVCVDLEPWETLIGASLKIEHIPGDHLDVLSNQAHVKVWAERLLAHLEATSDNAQPQSDSVPLGKARKLHRQIRQSFRS